MDELWTNIRVRRAQPSELHGWSIQEILQAARKTRSNTTKPTPGPTRQQRIEALVSGWLAEIADPNVDPVEFILRKIAELTVDTQPGHK